ncbi:MAG TPA: NAD(P)-dependent oxidoreductase [Candidatus Hydrogenedentes bacterium]|nr:NAD(P)-dependent oxidoreductase [Candidatus Hydrogenedentota bacterium]HRT20948.1 NAD(P)-dependent oxidoreductase [Candidatus Hydrogenedentota bacterium]HRT63471.1 NAD(P)-dependent oxidoreductase [Candidatus Hydrogenedentota bacterium]
MNLSAPVIVFGGGEHGRGFIGGVLYRAFFRSGSPHVIGFASRDADLCDRKQTESLLPRIPTHAAWIVAAARNPDDPRPASEALRVNAAIAEHIAHIAGMRPPVHLVYLSSIDVYGRTNLALPLDECSPLRPESPYAAGKLAAEGILDACCERQGIPLTILRLPGVYGPGDTHHGPVRAFLDAARHGKPAVVHGNGRQRRDLLYVGDIPRLVVEILGKRVPGVFNAVTGTTASLNEIIALIECLSGKRLDVRYNPEMPQYDIVFAPSGLLCRLPDFAFTDIKTGLAETWACLNNQARHFA